ncbi:VOC family protein [Virgibacillus kekensis]|uniref:VOC family protein n=1 Tax=Virgibacillus kekensis TaxID=202261 RepID=A0ABV9DHH1_9BACI
MNSPIKNQVNTIFIHVSDLTRSVEWYSKLLGQEYDLSAISRPVYNLKINHHTGVTLDAGPEGSTKQLAPSQQPLFNFATENIHEAYEYVRQLGYETAGEIVTFDDFAFFNVVDPDGNRIMICTG